MPRLIEIFLLLTVAKEADMRLFAIPLLMWRL
jgi:hypothetical protein